jgi:hypothetical protein
MIEDSKILKTLSELTSDSYKLFSDYCLLLEKGLRKDALKHLDSFIEMTNNWDINSKITFCNLIFNSIRLSKDLNVLLTTILREKLIKPTLKEMILTESQNYLPFLWYGQYCNDTKYLKKAFELNPDDTTTKISLLDNLAKDIWSSTHHLPEGYCDNNLAEDTIDINLAFSILETIDDKTAKDYIKMFEDYRNSIENYKRNK